MQVSLLWNMCVVFIKKYIVQGGIKMMEIRRIKAGRTFFKKLLQTGRRRKQNFDKLLCKTSLSFMCCSYSIYFIFYAWCVYSLLSNQFFVIPICLVTFFFFLLDENPLDSSEKYKTFSYSWFWIHLTTWSSSHTSFTVFRCSIFNPKTPQVLWLCSGTFWWEFSFFSVLLMYWP